MAITLDGTSGITTPTYGGTVSSEYVTPVTAFKNRIINGAMIIDQRNSAGSAVTLNANLIFITDRFRSAIAGQAWGTGVLTGQQVVDAPTGFYNSLKLTVSTADSSIAAGDGYALTQTIEASNVYDFNWGSSSASPATLSFWVKSSVTGTYGLGIQSIGSTTYSYVATYSIPVANTWTYITISIPAQTTNNTPNTGTNYSIQVQFDLGSGSNTYGTANTWQSGTFVKTSGSVNWISNAAATFNITGVQLEKGSTATSFDYRPYATELALCQRYYQKFVSDGAFAVFGGNQAISSTFCNVTKFLFVPLRIPPTVADFASASLFQLENGSSVINISALSINTPASSTFAITVQCTAATALTAGTYYMLDAKNSAAAYIGVGAEA